MRALVLVALTVLIGCTGPPAESVDTDTGDPDGDRDGDRWTNAEEDDAGSDPDDCGSVPPGEGHWPDCRATMRADGLEGGIWGVGEQAPDARFLDQFGQEVTLHQFYGDVVVVALCATWCGPCHDHAEQLQGLAQGWPGRVSVVNLITQGDSGEPEPGEVAAWAEEHEITAFPVAEVLDATGEGAPRAEPGADLFEALEAQYWPSNYLLDEALTLQEGEMWINDTPIEGAIEALLEDG